MKGWGKITMFKYQQIDVIASNPRYDELDKVLFTAGVVYDITENDINSKGATFAAKLIRKVNALFAIPFKAVVPRMIGKYRMLYDVPNFTFGQYVELAFFFQRPGLHAHYILASCSRRVFGRYQSEGHKERADYFHAVSCQKAVGAVEAIKINLEMFNTGFEHLFGLDHEAHAPKAQSDKFNSRYGWTYSAAAVAEYLRIPLDDVYNIPAREALNHLAYLKEKSQYEIRERDRLMKQHQLLNNG